jgi:dolichol-phosphate mannosyltransferase
MVAWVGFPQTSVSYVRAPRAGGETKYPLSKMMKFAWNAAVSFSPLPIRLSLWLGTGTALFGMGYGLFALAAYFRGQTETGWASLAVLICIIGGAILVSIGLLGEYVARIFEEIKHRPLYVIAATANVTTNPPEQESRAVAAAVGRRN